MRMLRQILESIIPIGVIGVACWNIGVYTSAVMRHPPREVHDVVSAESAWAPVYLELMRVNYRIGDLGYVTPGILRGEPYSEIDRVRGVELSYVVIPWDLVVNKRDSPIVLADFRIERPAQLPPGLEPIFDPGTGFVLLKSTG